MSKITEYQFSENFDASKDVQSVFQRDGAFLVRNFLSDAEYNRILQNLQNQDVLEKAVEQGDGQGSYARMLIWNQPGGDVTGMLSRCEKVVDTCEKLLEGEVYHYHSKVSMKDEVKPGKLGGGQFRWHQDYGYWYNNGLLKPDLINVFIALDKATTANGCLQIIPGTNRCGRIDHEQLSGQMIASQETVDQILSHDEHSVVNVEMEKGDALFFHCNVLHRSDQNKSDKRRWAMVLTYNKRSNNSVFEHFHASYTPLHKVENSAILTCPTLCDFSDKDLWDVNDPNANPMKSKDIFMKQVVDIKQVS